MSAKPLLSDMNIFDSH